MAGNDEDMDNIPLADAFLIEGPDARSISTALFYSCNTIVSIRAVAQRGTLESAARRVQRAFWRHERLFSRMLPHSDVSRLNASGGRAVEIAPETAELLHASLRYCAASQGRFDITIGSVSRLWDFHTGRTPKAVELTQALRHVDWRGVHVERGDGTRTDGEVLRVSSSTETAEKGAEWTCHMDDPEAMIDLGGAAKGWMADRACELLLDAGLSNFAVSLGGNVAARGSDPEGDGWAVAVRGPHERHDGQSVVAADTSSDRSSAPIVLRLHDASAVTSGTYERAFIRDGILYHHILDPKTGMPAATDAVSATLVCNRSMDAEGFSTTVLVLGMEAGAAFVRERPEIREAILIGVDGAIVRSPLAHRKTEQGSLPVLSSTAIKA